MNSIANHNFEQYELIENTEVLSENFVIEQKLQLLELKSLQLDDNPDNMLDFLLADQKLDDPLFLNDIDFQVFKLWAEETMYITVEKSSDVNRNTQKHSCIKKKFRIGEPKKLVLELPDDLTQVKVSDIPIIVGQINKQTFGNDLPDYASVNEVSEYMTTLIAFLDENGKTDLVTKYTDFYNECDYPESSVNQTILAYLTENYDLNDPNIAQQIEYDLSFFLKRHLFESAFEGGIKILFDNMQAPHGVKNLVKTLDKEYKNLERARKSGNNDQIKTAEMELIKQINRQVYSYNTAIISSSDPSKVNPIDQHSSATDVLETKTMLCLSRVTLMHSLLEEFGIVNGVAELDRHIVNVVELCDGTRYAVDATVRSTPYRNSLDRYDDDYQNKVLFDSFGSGMSVEKILTSDLMHNLISTSYDNELLNIMLLQYAVKMNSDHLRTQMALGYKYNNLGMENESYASFLMAEATFKQLIANKTNPDTAFLRIGKYIYSKMDYLNDKCDFDPDIDRWGKYLELKDEFSLD